MAWISRPSANVRLLIRVRWGDALEEAGFVRNKFKQTVLAEILIQKFTELIRDTKQENKLRFTLEGEVRR